MEPKTVTFKSKFSSYQCGTNGDGQAIARFENFTYTCDEAHAKELRKLPGFGTDFTELKPEIVEAAKAPDDDKDAKPVKLNWCVQGDDGAILRTVLEENDAFAFEWTNEPGECVGFRIKADASEFIKRAQLEGAKPLWMLDGYTAAKPLAAKDGGG